VEIAPSLLNLAWYLAGFAGLLALFAIALLLYRRVMWPGSVALLNDRDRRLGVVYQAPVDGRRRLLLIRRDDVEHLVMTGGPIDVVIETGIGGEDADTSKQPEQTPLSPLDDGRIQIAEAQTERS